VSSLTTNLTLTNHRGSGSNTVSYGLGITAGPDGNMWFANNVGSSIGRVVTGASPPA
jgi:streptogramin lyase